MPVIEVTGLRKQYGSTVAVEDVSFTVEAGEIFGILGPNGAGKTTTVECVTGLRRPDRGRLRVLGRDPQRDHDELSELVGVQLQDSQLPDKIRVSEALDLYASFYRNPARADELISRLGLADRRDAFFCTLSGGQKQRLSVALALIGNPPGPHRPRAPGRAGPPGRRVRRPHRQVAAGRRPRRQPGQRGQQ